MIKPIRLIRRSMLSPLIPSLGPIQLRIRFPYRHRDGSVVEQIPQCRVAQPLRAADPGLGLVTNPGEDGREKSVDVGVLPLLEESGLEGPFLLFELLVWARVSN